MVMFAECTYSVFSGAGYILGRIETVWKKVMRGKLRSVTISLIKGVVLWVFAKKKVFLNWLFPEIGEQNS